MRIAITIVRSLLGVMLLFFGLNGIFQFQPMPNFNGLAEQFMSAFAQSGFMYVVVTAKLVVGGMLLANFKPHFANVIFFPITVGIVLFHALMDLQGIAPGAFLLALQVFVFVAYQQRLKCLLS